MVNSLEGLLKLLKKEKDISITIVPVIYIDGLFLSEVSYLLEVTIRRPDGLKYTYKEKSFSTLVDIMATVSNQNFLVLCAHEYKNEIIENFPQTTVRILDENEEEIPSPEELAVQTT